MTHQCEEISREATLWMRQLMFGLGDAENPNAESVEYLITVLRGKLRGFLWNMSESRTSRIVNETVLGKCLSNYPVALESIMKSVRVEDAMRDSSDGLDGDDRKTVRGHRSLRRIYSDCERDLETVKQSADWKKLESMDVKNMSRLQRLERYTRNMTPADYQKYSNARSHHGSAFRRPKYFTKWLMEMEEELVNESVSNKETSDSKDDDDHDPQRLSGRRGLQSIFKRSHQPKETQRRSSNTDGTPSKRPRQQSVKESTSSPPDKRKMEVRPLERYHNVDLDVGEFEVESSDHQEQKWKFNVNHDSPADLGAEAADGDISTKVPCDQGVNIDSDSEGVPVPRTTADTDANSRLSLEPVLKKLSEDIIESKDSSNSNQTKETSEALEDHIMATNSDMSFNTDSSKLYTVETIKQSNDTNDGLAKENIGESTKTIDLTLDEFKCESDKMDKDALEKVSEVQRQQGDESKSLHNETVSVEQVSPELEEKKSNEKNDGVGSTRKKISSVQLELFGDDDDDSDTDEISITQIHRTDNQFQPFFDSDEGDEIKQEATDDEDAIVGKGKKRLLILSDSEPSVTEQEISENASVVGDNGESSCEKDVVCNRRRKAGLRPKAKAIAKPDISSARSKEIVTTNVENISNRSTDKSMMKNSDISEESVLEDASPPGRYSLRSSRRRTRSQSHQNKSTLSQDNDKQEKNGKSRIKSRQSSENGSQRKLNSIEIDNFNRSEPDESHDKCQLQEAKSEANTHRSSNGNERQEMTHLKDSADCGSEAISPNDKSTGVESSNQLNLKDLNISQTADTMLYSLGCDFIGRVIDQVFKQRAIHWPKKAVEEVSLFHVQIQKHELVAAVAEIDFLGPKLDDLAVNLSIDSLQVESVDNIAQDPTTSMITDTDSQNFAPNVKHEKMVQPLSTNFVSPPAIKNTAIKESRVILSKLSVVSDNDRIATSPHTEESSAHKKVSKHAVVESSQDDKTSPMSFDYNQPMLQSKDTVLATLKTETEMARRLSLLKSSPISSKADESNENQRIDSIDDSDIECPVTDTIVNAVMDRLPEAAVCLNDIFEREDKSIKPLIAMALVNLPSSGSRLSLCRVIHDLSRDPTSSRDAVFKVLDRLNDVPNKASRIKLVDAMVEMMKKRKKGDASLSFT